MQALRIHGPADMRLDDVAEPVPGPGDVIIRVAACGICGTDTSFIKMGGMDVATRGPMALGHEISGVVAAKDDAVVSVDVGDRVVVNPDGMGPLAIGTGSAEGGFSSHLLVRAADTAGRLIPVPAGLDLTLAAFAEPLAVGMHAADRASAGVADKVVIFGGGPVGLAALARFLDLGTSQVIVVDLSERRLELARKLGAQAAFNPSAGNLWEHIRELHGSVPHMFGPTVGTNCFLEASGAPSVITDVIANARFGASLTVVSMHMDDVPISFLLVLTKQLTIRGAIEYPDGLQPAVDLLSRRDLAPIVTHTFPADRFQEALDTLEQSRECGKVLITFPDGAS